jgi:hypothetical protein
VDLQHGLVGYSGMLAIDAGATSVGLVRVEASDATAIGRALVAGAGTRRKAYVPTCPCARPFASGPILRLKICRIPTNWFIYFCNSLFCSGCTAQRRGPARAADLVAAVNLWLSVGTQPMVPPRKSSRTAFRAAADQIPRYPPLVLKNCLSVPFRVTFVTSAPFLET